MAGQRRLHAYVHTHYYTRLPCSINITYAHHVTHTPYWAGTIVNLTYTWWHSRTRLALWTLRTYIALLRTRLSLPLSRDWTCLTYMWSLYADALLHKHYIHTPRYAHALLCVTAQAWMQVLCTHDIITHAHSPQTGKKIQNLRMNKTHLTSAVCPSVWRWYKCTYTHHITRT